MKVFEGGLGETFYRKFPPGYLIRVFPGFQWSSSHMAEDILDVLKKKEARMEAMLEEARKEADARRAEAVKRAGKLAEERREELERELAAERAEAEKALAAEIEAVEEEGRRAVEELKARAAGRIDEAVRAVVDFVTRSLR